MGYSISEVAKRTGLSIFTLRYYDKVGLLPFVDRTPRGVRDFKESDFDWLAVITCLKETGMPVKEIKQFIDWCLEGDSTLKDRLEVFIEHKKKVAEQIKLLEKHMKKIDHKIWYYETSLTAGTESIHSDQKCKLREIDSD